ncbi:MAG: MinD/ParA family protein [bacterium]|nr:MinD/ParA family protein [bacterium]
MTATRIITVSSGKGGVGKTTFALNFALTLSRIAPTVLIDLDTGTSSVRNTLDTHIGNDLYHFFRKGHRLDDCLTQLDDRLDPRGMFKNFAFIAAPRHAIDEITNLADQARWRLVHAINSLPARFVILDLRAGLDANVLDFLPLSNSGILVFTPHHPAATMAAGDIVKSLLFRKLRFIFAEDSPFYHDVSDRHMHRIVNDLLDDVEDVYEDRLPNLDAFLGDLLASIGQNQYLDAIADVINSFGVYFVLNMFDGVDESYDNAIRPFIEYLTKYVSAQLNLTNLGWVVHDQAIHRANCNRRPILLNPVGRSDRPAVDPVLAELAKLEQTLVGLPSRPTPAIKNAWRDEVLHIDPHQPLHRELEVLQQMYKSQGRMKIQDNFAYIANRALHVIQSLPAESFGHPKLYTPFEIFQHLFPNQPNL